MAQVAITLISLPSDTPENSLVIAIPMEGQEPIFEEGKSFDMLSFIEFLRWAAEQRLQLDIQDDNIVLTKPRRFLR